MIDYFLQSNDYAALLMIGAGFMAFVVQIYCVCFYKDKQ